MEKGRGARTIGIIALVVAVVGMSVGFAALQQILTISGSTTVKGSTWGVSFQSLNEPDKTGSATIDTEAELKLGSTTMDFAVSLYQPNDEVIYTFQVKNTGSINAKISAISLSGVDTATAANVTYTLTYGDDSPINVNDTLDANEVKNLKLTVLYNDVASVSSADILLSLGATITYVQQ